MRLRPKTKKKFLPFDHLPQLSVIKVFIRLIEKRFDNNVLILDFGCGAGGGVMGIITLGHEVKDER